MESAESVLRPLLDRLDREVVGQSGLLERLVIALLAGGHVLVEGVPGLAKTRAVRALAQALDLPFRRIQFTPDLLPADLLGTQVYHPSTATFAVRRGPILTSVLLADEINRAPAKVQSALLEAMQDRQVTIGDETIRLPEPFWVLATQNPIEQEGTYPLPEAQLDRFLMKLVVGYPPREAELAMLDLPGVLGDRPAEPPLVGPSEVLELQALTARIAVAPSVKEYMVDLVRATREPTGAGADRPSSSWGLALGHPGGVPIGPGPCAPLHGRDYVTPHDVKAIARDVLRHRVLVSFEADAEGVTADDLLGRILDHPRALRRAGRDATAWPLAEARAGRSSRLPGWIVSPW
ncbi:MAG: AAA family ATPase [Isosphaeraceae bacterium]